MKIEEMADVFLNSANFAPHVFLTLAPPSSYALNLKALIKVSKVSWTSQLSYEILRSSFERKFDNTNFISPKRTPPNNPGFLGLNIPFPRNKFHKNVLIVGTYYMISMSNGNFRVGKFDQTWIRICSMFNLYYLEFNH